MKVPASLRYAARRVLRLPQIPLGDVARRSWVVHPAVRESRPRAFFLDGQLDRVTGVQDETTLDNEVARVTGREVVHGATMAYELADALIVGGSVYAGGARRRLLRGSFLSAALAPVEEELDRAALDSTFNGNRYFGHWVADDCTLHLLARELAPPVGVRRPDYAQEGELCQLWGLRARKVSAARVRALLCFTDRGQNPAKRERYDRLRAPLLARAGRGPRRPVYLRRCSVGTSRDLTNEAEIEERLARRGFVIVDPSRERIDVIAARCAGAPCAVGVEGSQLAHGFLNVAAGGAIVALQPPRRFNNVYKDRADCVGLRYGFVVGREEARGFRVDADEIERTLDLVGSA